MHGRNDDVLRTSDVFLLGSGLLRTCSLLNVDHKFSFSLVLVDWSGGVMDIFTIFESLACSTACIPTG